ncbi:hypothetical protein MIND_00655800 [Mycena indigotica]|uniref:Uncharacterized protein n=1 Tax=Mycena indigotica TaxID=2126181 RepID=A0A8H6W0F8_9AGAR|nr:uncharacterized protein MIND_00655800 [Mycena indigotica]KAF7300929.1 hypothetical protein MIND_00655800 [Mycena indigotica]
MAACIVSRDREWHLRLLVVFVVKSWGIARMLLHESNDLPGLAFCYPGLSKPRMAFILHQIQNDCANSSSQIEWLVQSCIAPSLPTVAGHTGDHLGPMDLFRAPTSIVLLEIKSCLEMCSSLLCLFDIREPKRHCPARMRELTMVAFNVALALHSESSSGVDSCCRCFRLDYLPTLDLSLPELSWRKSSNLALSTFSVDPKLVGQSDQTRNVMGGVGSSMGVKADLYTERV